MPARGATLDPVAVAAVRNIACAAVVVMHANTYARPDPDAWVPLGVAGAPFFALAVPTFLVLSGYYAIGHAPGAPGAAEGLRRHLGRLIWPFVFWNAANVAVLACDGEQGAIGSLGDALTGVFQLWFVFVLMQLQLVAAGLGRWLRPARLDAFLAVSATISAAALALADWRLFAADDGATWQLVVGKSAPGWLAFYALGIWLRWRPGALDWTQARLGWVALAGAPAYLAYLAELDFEGRGLGDHGDLQLLAAGLPFRLLGATALILGVARLRRAAWTAGAVGALAKGSRHTFGIYLAHGAALFALYAAWRNLGLPLADWTIVPALALGAWLTARSLAGVAAGRITPPWLSRLTIGVAAARRSTSPANPGVRAPTAAGLRVGGKVR